MKARFSDYCVRCNGTIAKGDPIASHRLGYIHASCASGADDE